MEFGDTWHARNLPFWERMATRSHDTPASRVMAAAAAKASSIIEIGCGAGDLAVYCAASGFGGKYWGCDISKKAVEAANAKLRELQRAGKLIDGVATAGNFLELAADGKVPEADVAISRDAVQHQSHWMPLALAALRCAPRVLIAVTRPNYFREGGDRHTSRDYQGHFDLCIALGVLQTEARAVGIPVKLHRSTNQWGAEVAIELSR